MVPTRVDPARSSLVELNRTTLRLWEWGDVDAPPVVCCHGGFDHGRMWDGLAPRLADRGYRVVAPDLRGHGDSGRLGCGHVWEACALDLGLLARGLGERVGFVGHSFGAGQALMVAAVWPEQVPWVVVLDGLGPPPAVLAEENADLVGNVTRSLDALERFAARPPKVFASRDEMVERRAAVNHRLPRDWVEHLVEHGSRPVDGGFVWKSDPLFSVGFPGGFSVEHLQAELSAVTAPTLVLTGTEHDTWTDLTDDQIAERVGWIGAEHRVIAGTGHYVHVEAPAETMAAIDDFLTGVGP